MMQQSTIYNQVDDVRFSKALRNLAGLTPTRRKQAEQELVAMGPDALMRLLREYKRLTSVAARRGVFYLLLNLPVQIMHIVKRHVPGLGHYASLLYELILFWGGILIISASIIAWRLLRIRHALAAFDDPRVIGPVAELIKNSRKRKRGFWRARLIQLLAQVEHADQETLRQVDCGILNSIFSTETDRARAYDKRDNELARAILKAYPYIGDAAALKQVRFVAGRSIDPLRFDARDCLPELEARVAAEAERRKLEQVGADLLRASSSDATSASTLLRAAAPNTATTPDQQQDQLLRPLENRA
jgi:hypothetical protein